MRAVGLSALLLGVLVFLYPQLHEFYPAFVHLKGQEHLLVGGLLVAVGAITLGVHRA